MLETVREYALERLEQSGDAERARRRHSGYFLALVERAEQELEGLAHVKWLDRLEIELDNLRATFQWALESGETSVVFGLSGSLWEFWNSRGFGGFMEDARRWVEAALTLPVGDQPELRLKVLKVGGGAAFYMGEFERCRRLTEECLAIAREASHPAHVARTLSNLGTLSMTTGAWDEAEHFLAEAQETARSVGDMLILGLVLGNQGDLARIRGDYPRALDLLEEALTCYTQTEHLGRLAWIQSNLALLAAEMGEPARAAALLRESMYGAGRTVDIDSIGQNLMVASELTKDRKPQRGVCLLAALDAIYERSSWRQRPDEARVCQRRVAEFREQLGEDAFTQAWREGSMLTLDEAIACALEEAGEAVEATEASP